MNNTYNAQDKVNPYGATNPTSSKSVNLVSKLDSLPLRPQTLSMLLRRGFTTTHEIESSKKQGGISNLASELGCSLQEAVSITREIESVKKSLSSSSYTSPSPSSPSSSKLPSKSGSGGITAAALLQSIRSGRSAIITFCQSLDKLLGGGIQLSELTEIVGTPGVGKTQLGMQLAVNAKLPLHFGGVCGDTIYIDSEGSFAPERCLSMAQCLVSHVQSTFKRRKDRYLLSIASSTSSLQRQKEDPPKGIPKSFNAENILDGIHVYRVHDEATQVATIQYLSNFIRQKMKSSDNSKPSFPVKLIILDSIAFHYRSANSDYMARTRSITKTAQMLSELATEFDLAVVVINHMTTRIVNGKNNTDKSNQNDNSLYKSISMSSMEVTTSEGYKLTPALGESWAHSVTTRLILSYPRDNNKCCSSSNQGNDAPPVRRCSLVKSPHKPNGHAFYTILEQGVRDCGTQSTLDLSEQNNPSKRPRVAQY